MKVFGKIGDSRNPETAIEAHWLPADCADDVLHLTRTDSGDILAAARKLGVPILRTMSSRNTREAAVARIEQRLAAAKVDGMLRFFNTTFRTNHLQAQTEGRSFISYQSAQARLRKTIISVAAGDPAALVTRVFGDRAAPQVATI